MEDKHAEMLEVLKNKKMLLWFYCARNKFSIETKSGVPQILIDEMTRWEARTVEILKTTLFYGDLNVEFMKEDLWDICIPQIYTVKINGHDVLGFNRRLIKIVPVISDFTELLLSIPNYESTIRYIVYDTYVGTIPIENVIKLAEKLGIHIVKFSDVQPVEHATLYPPDIHEQVRALLPKKQTWGEWFFGISPR